MKYMKNADILTGRIIQRVLEARLKGASETSVCHGVNNSYSIHRIIDNLFEYFPDGRITLKKLPFGYELDIKVKFK